MLELNRMNHIPENMPKILFDKNTQKRTYNRLYLGSYGVFHIDNQTEIRNGNQGQIPDLVNMEMESRSNP